MAGAIGKGSAGGKDLPDGVLSAIESKVACLEEQFTAIEGLVE